MPAAGPGFEQVNHVLATCGRCGDPQQRAQRSAFRTACLQGEQADCAGPAPGSLEDPGIDKLFERCGGLLNVVSKTGKDLLGGQQCAGMPDKEQEQVEVAGAADASNLIEHRAQVLCVDEVPLLVKGLTDDCPSAAGVAARQA